MQGQGNSSCLAICKNTKVEIPIETENSHLRGLKLSKAAAVVFGILWGIDGYYKFQMNLYAQLPSIVQGAGVGQPPFLSGWFSFWSGVAASQPMLITYAVGMLELAISFALITGFLRKFAYIGGMAVGLFIWAIPEGFGGPYGPGSVDLGGGNIYALGLLFLLIIDATYGPSPFTLDAVIEKRVAWWNKLAEIRYDTGRRVWKAISDKSMHLSRVTAIIFGTVYALEAFLAFYYNLPNNIVSVVSDQASGAPAFLNGWFAFWLGQVTAAPVFYAYLVGGLEAALAFSLLCGFARKTAYIGGAVFAIIAWGVGEGFGGMPVPGYTDPGTGIVQAIAMLILLGLNSLHGTDPFTVDAIIEKSHKWWRKIAELSPAA